MVILLFDIFLLIFLFFAIRETCLNVDLKYTKIHTSNPLKDNHRYFNNLIQSKLIQFAN